jgi:hypothetical protein
MKQFALWAALIVATGTATSLTVIHFRRASSTLKQFVSPGPLSPGHAYLGDRCASCHESTVGVTVAKCTACHANAERLLTRQPTAFHASIQECATCHVEHGTANIRPLKMDHVELARVGTRTLVRASRRDADSAATLTSLQTWLHIQTPEQLNAGSAREALSCAGCHDRRDPHLRRFGSDCAQCHQLESWTVPDYQHPSARSTDCVQCHQAPPSHSMGHFAMVSQRIAGNEARVDQCFQCHNTTGWNDIVNIGFYDHH